MTREWGCPTCKCQESWMLDAARDEDGYPVRLRGCVNCGAQWSTEEVPIASDAFWPRAHSRNARRNELRRREVRPCRWCGVPYRYGSFSRHVAQSQVHERALVPKRRDRVKARRWEREWLRRRKAAS